MRNFFLECWEVLKELYTIRKSMSDFSIFAGLCNFSRGNKDWEPDIYKRLNKTREEYELTKHPRKDFWKDLKRS